MCASTCVASGYTKSVLSDEIRYSMYGLFGYSEYPLSCAKMLNNHKRYGFYKGDKKCTIQSALMVWED